MATEILTPTQVALLKALGGEGFFKKNFYLTGGTALAGLYLHHRYSEDLDFFSVNEVDTLPIISFFKKHKGDLGIADTTSETSMNRNLFFLSIDGETLKTEFTCFPFPPMEKPEGLFGMPVDSVKGLKTLLLVIYLRNYQHSGTRQT